MGHSGGGYVDITEAQLGWIVGCLRLFGLVIGYPSIMPALAVGVYSFGAQSI
jgi:hypothetical protein